MVKFHVWSAMQSTVIHIGTGAPLLHGRIMASLQCNVPSTWATTCRHEATVEATCYIHLVRSTTQGTPMANFTTTAGAASEPHTPRESLACMPPAGAQAARPRARLARLPHTKRAMWHRKPSIATRVPSSAALHVRHPLPSAGERTACRSTRSQRASM